MTVLYICAHAAPVEQFSSGEAAIGTGAQSYRLRQWVKDGQMVLERKPDYWGHRVTFRLIPGNPTRVAALLNSEVDMINDVPLADINRLKATPEVHVIMRSGERIMIVTLDGTRDISSTQGCVSQSAARLARP